MKDSKRVFIIYGLPGSGKGTQAEILADKFGLIHFNTGKVIEGIINDPEKLKDPLIQKQKYNFEQGLLCDPRWVTELVVEELKNIYQQGKGVVFSGSPRTLYEAERIIPELEKLYGKDNITVIEIIIKPETSIFRNSHRKICEQCGTPILYTKENENLKYCPKCGGKIVTRALDEPAIIQTRIKEYQERTEPIYEFLNLRNIKIHRIDGEPLPEIVTENILKSIHLQ